MSTENVESTATAGEGKLYYFLPEQIIHDEQINLRPFSGGTEGLEELAQSIKEHGQQEPVVVRFDTQLQPHLIAGNRRTTAISLINSGIEDQEPKVLVKCVEGTTANGGELDDKSAWLAAWAENKDRDQMTAMDKAMNLQTARTMHNLHGKKGTKKLAELLGVSPAFVTTHEKLLGLTAELQRQASDEGWTADYAIELATTAPAKVVEVQAAAQQIAEVEAAKKTTKAPKTQKGAKAATAKAPKEVKASAKHVRKAKKQLEAEAGKKKARTRTDLVDFVESELQSPLFGHPNGQVQKFVTYLLSWMKGEGTDKGLVSHFRAMTEGADHGTAEKPKEPAVVVPHSEVRKAAKAADKKKALKPTTPKKTKKTKKAAKTKPKTKPKK